MDSNWSIEEELAFLPVEARKKLRLFHVELLRFNRTINLISRNSILDSDRIHVLDGVLGSVAIHSEIRLRGLRSLDIFDVGSGNGVPGIVYGVIFPESKVCLLEFDQRKSEFLRLAIARLGLTNVSVECGDARVAIVSRPGIFISRGFCSLKEATHDYASACPEEFVWFHLKGNDWEEEVCRCSKCSTWNIRNAGKYVIPGVNKERTVVSVTKTKD